MFSRRTRLCGIRGDLMHSLAWSYLTPPARLLAPSPMAHPPDSTQTAIRNVVMYPVDGSEPRIIQRSFSHYGASQHPFPHNIDLDIELADAYGAENMAGTCAKVLGARLPVHPYAHYVVYHNISPDLSVNLALARLVGVAPRRLGHPLLWRGDVFVIRRGYLTGPGQETRLENLHVLSDAIEVLNTLIPRWYHSDEWATFHQEELIRNRLQRVNSPRRRIYAEKIAMLEQLINYSTAPTFSKFLKRDVFLFPADGGDPRIVRRWLGPPVEDRRPYGSQHYGIELDLRAIYGLENMFALRRISLDGRLNGYTMYFNLSPTLPANLAIAKAVGVNSENPGVRLLCRGDAVIVKNLTVEWDRGGRVITAVKITNMKPQDALQIVDTGLIPKLYNSVSWQDLLYLEEQFDKHWREGNQSVDRRRACDKMVCMVQQLKVIHHQDKRAARDRTSYERGTLEPGTCWRPPELEGRRFQEMLSLFSLCYVVLVILPTLLRMLWGMLLRCIDALLFMLRDTLAQFIRVFVYDLFRLIVIGLSVGWLWIFMNQIVQDGGGGGGGYIILAWSKYLNYEFTEDKYEVL
ncbi:hypothetical protein C8R47DRAFT_1328859 [Mycena vitilis]|nr:hypothetical protein C8R47DRAFT_1328859 [Mycena vitilis]